MQHMTPTYLREADGIMLLLKHRPVVVDVTDSQFAFVVILKNENGI